MIQNITITADTKINLKPLIEGALRSEIRLLELGIERTLERVRAYEQQYGLPIAEFEHQFEAGGTDDDLDFVEFLRGSLFFLDGSRLHIPSSSMSNISLTVICTSITTRRPTTHSCFATTTRHTIRTSLHFLITSTLAMIQPFNRRQRRT